MLEAEAAGGAHVLTTTRYVPPPVLQSTERGIAGVEALQPDQLQGFPAESQNAKTTLGSSSSCSHDGIDRSAVDVINMLDADRRGAGTSDWQTV